jgi:hypothetical protein
MTEASRVQTLLNEQNAEIDRLKNRIAQLEDANLKQSCIKVDDEARIGKLEAALRVYADEDHWFGDKFEPIMFPEGECKCCYEHFSDQGEIARKALNTSEERVNKTGET